MRALLRPSVTRAKLSVATASFIAVPLAAAACLDPAPSQSYATKVGELRRVALDSQAIAHLNTDTVLSVTTTRERCEILLSRGEVLLEIPRDHVPGVRVRAGNVVAQAQADVATFSVRLRDASHVDVLVHQGSLALRSLSAGPRRAFKDTRLAANQSAHITPSGVGVKDLGESEVVRRLQWTAGMLWFQGETLEEATEEFNRCNLQRLVIEDPGIAEMRLGGKFQCTSPERFVEALRALGVRRLERMPSDASGRLIRLVGAR